MLYADNVQEVNGMIQIIGPALNQWDTGRSVTVTNIEADHVHFANKGDSKAVIMELVETQAKIPDYLLQTGKQLCVYAVKDGITLESKVFFVKNRERPENYVYEDDQRNYIYVLISNAEAATEGANTAAGSAELAAKNANESADSANLAAENANKSADSANLAAKNANEAAAKAAHTAKSLMVVGKAAGANINLDDAIDQFLVGLRIFGKTTQAGTPTPDAPVDLVSVVNPTVTVNDQTLSVPYTLHGIPVKSGGNYTDANGQRWICDEIDFGRGVYVQRVMKKTFDGSSDEPWWIYSNTIYPGYAIAVVDMAGGFRQNGYCDKFPINLKEDSSTDPGIWLGVDSNIIYIHNTKDIATSIANWLTWLSANPVTVLYILSSPIETPLSEEELAAYATLRTYRGNTTVSNDASAHMEIEYVMDAKKYIDSMISTGIIAATVE